MKDVFVGFLWHMHQPYYKDPVSGALLMPWVRLHAIRGYYDMIALLAVYPDIRCTINLVPSLLAQLLDYTEEGLRDSDFLLSQKKASDLTADEKKQVISRFFMCNHHTMIAPFPRYQGLLEKRGRARTHDQLDAAVKEFTSQDILDLQVLFNLTWIGFMGRKDKGIADLIKKGRSFTEADKAYVLEFHIKIMEQLVPLYRQRSDEGQIEISTSPFYHPISPLLMNVGFALRSLDTPLPREAFSHPEDLDAQVRKAREFHDRVFGRPPTGMWPSEGSVCPEMVEILEKNKIRWMASDESILFLSLKQARTGSLLYQPYRVVSGDAEVAMYFRDRPLSDHISFVYAKNPPENAVKDFLYHLDNIRKASKAYDFEPFVPIILDGENPWEHYPDGGEGFLRGVFERLTTTPGLHTSHFGDFLETHPPRATIGNLYTGSWINHNFAIWIGHEEDRKAWEYLARTRAYVESKGEDAHPLAWEEIYIAQGSDWFWWYGEDFTTENDEDFDRLFRLHLRNCYELHHDTPPQELSESIITLHDITPMSIPTGFVAPILDGAVSHFYEWRKAGHYRGARNSASMYQHDQVLADLYFGFDAKHLHMRMDFTSPPGKLTIMLHIMAPKAMLLTIPVPGENLAIASVEGEDLVHTDEISTMKVGAILEFSVPFAALLAEAGQRMRFFVSITKGGLEVERHPGAGLLSFTVPDSGTERILWYA
ncbi:MAG: glycoside hydrolase family 57 protein [Desulfomonilia bacterium]|nr:glycoside hydrolase family 57 protein [Desulfomonilia bacterium]